MKKILIKNAILFITGFCAYITIECCFRGYSFPIMGACGGLSIVLLDKINDKISWEIDLTVQGFIGMSLITTLELIIGLIAKRTNLLPIMWDYSSIPFNFEGVICLTFSICWFFLSIVAIFLADSINYYVLNEEQRPYYKIFRKFLFSFPER